MPRIQTSCPRCRQPIVADVQQLFDMTTDPTAKQKLLSPGTNTARCQACGYEGMMATPIVYHDPEKEFLLTYFPPELGLPLNAQEKQIGPLINQVVNALPAEKRKGYLFSPQTMFTFQTMIDKILEGDGITKEMIEAQQKRVGILQRLLTTSNSEDRITIIHQEVESLDGEFFAILGTVLESAMAQGDEKAAGLLKEIQMELLKETKVGQELLAQSTETQAALKLLQDASKSGLTREKLLEILLGLKSENSLTTVVSLTRSGLDYQFFQILSEQIDKADAEKKQPLVNLRDTLLKLTLEIDKELKRRIEESTKLLNSILSELSIEEAVKKNLPRIDEFFSQSLQVEFEAAHQNNDVARIEKIQKVISVLEKESAPPPEMEFIQQLLEVKDDESRIKILRDNPSKLNDNFLQTLNSIINEGETQNQSPQLLEALKTIYKNALRITMENNLNG
jgi:hypothetical protein